MALSWVGKTAGYVAAFAAAAPLGQELHRWAGIDAAVLNTHQSYNYGTNVWTTRAAYPVSVQGLNGTVANDTLYSWGGHDGAANISNGYKYTVASGWTAIAPHPATPRSGSAVWDGGDYIYMVDGFTYNTFRRYSISGNSWTDLALGPTVMGYTSAQYYNGAVYVYGGWDGANYTNFFYRYNVSTNNWTVLTANTASDHTGYASSALVGSKMYVFGARASATSSQSVQVWHNDLASLGWVRETDHPEARFAGGTGNWQLTASNTNPVLVISGGYNGTNYVGSTHTAEIGSPPNAPTLVSPAAGAYVDATGGIVFDWTHSDPDANPQIEYALRVQKRLP